MHHYTFINACQCGELDIIQRLVETFNVRVKYNEEVFAKICDNNQIKLMCWFLTKFPEIDVPNHFVQIHKEFFEKVDMYTKEDDVIVKPAVVF